MKYNEEHDRFIDDDFIVYRWSNNKDKLVQCHIGSNGKYKIITTIKGRVCLHRFIYETFKGKIPEGMEIDHFDTNKENNSLDNLILCTHKENMNNPKTVDRISKSVSKANKGLIKSDFGLKFKEHYGISGYQDIKLYNAEHKWYKRHNNKCRWEV